ncbi:hypothetical protein BJ742DRAFT_869556 [Cladochytrium replicatum]|nr:hypothetical protein BJ742DRAFT_869556 [Cladochytrium replicatum]
MEWVADHTGQFFAHRMEKLTLGTIGGLVARRPAGCNTEARESRFVPVRFWRDLRKQAMSVYAGSNSADDSMATFTWKIRRVWWETAFLATELAQGSYTGNKKKYQHREQRDGVMMKWKKHQGTRVNRRLFASSAIISIQGGASTVVRNLASASDQRMGKSHRGSRWTKSGRSAGDPARQLGTQHASWRRRIDWGRRRDRDFEGEMHKAQMIAQGGDGEADNEIRVGLVPTAGRPIRGRWGKLDLDKETVVW